MCKAQIRVDSNGNIGLKSTSTDASADIYLNGSAKILSLYYFSNSGTFRPWSSSNSNYIGNSTFPFAYIYGSNIYAGGNYLGSDKRFKENFNEIDSPLNKLLQLKGHKYDLIIDKNDSTITQKEQAKKEKLSKNKMGFIAQEVKEILPEAVVYDEEIDRYYLDYNAIIPVIVEAMKEQEAKIDALEKEIQSLKTAPKEKSATINNVTKDQIASLNQNIPNPFSENTKIEMVVPTIVSSAVLYIYNMQGNQIKQITITERGKTSVTIEGRTLKAGMYFYTLIADGKEVDTKKMILTK